MFRFKSYIGSKKGSLVLSLVASVTVAATILATHQVAQRFASGAVGAYNQQQAYILAQRSLTLAGLMVNRNIVLCSNVKIGDRVPGCVKGPLPNDQLAQSFNTSLGINSSYFMDEDAPSTAYGKKYLVLKHPNPEDSFNFIFKKAEVTWALRSLRDTNLRSVSGPFDRGYICRNKQTFEVIDGMCPDRPLMDALGSSPTAADLMKIKLKASKESDSLEQIECKKDSNHNGKLDASDTAITNSVCDYYVNSDQDGGIVFISVKVPYKVVDDDGGVGSKDLIVNGAIRRPMPIVKLHNDVNSAPTCGIQCTQSRYPDMDDSGATEVYPQCTGLFIPNTGGNQVSSNIVVKNYGPGALYGLDLRREDIDPQTGRYLYYYMIGLTQPSNSLQPADPEQIKQHSLEPFHSPYTSQRGIRVVTENKRCHPLGYQGLYQPEIMRVSCGCSSGTNTAKGVVCAGGSSLCGGAEDVFANNTGALGGTEVRNSLSGCVGMRSSNQILPVLANSFLNSYELQCLKQANCQFERMNSGITPPTESWCGNPYQGTQTTNPTGRRM